MRTPLLVLALSVSPFAMACGLLLETDPASRDGGIGPGVDGSTGGPDGALGDGAVTDGIVAPFDAGPPDAGPPVRAERCGGPETLRDNFDDNATDPLWVSFADRPGVEVRESSRQLEVQPPSGAMGYGGYISRFAIDLRDSWFSVRLVETPGEAAGLQTFMKLSTFDTFEEWILIHEDGQLLFVAPDGSARVPHDPAEQRFWRIREGGGRVFFETSPDGTTWTTHHEGAASEGIIAVQMSVGAGTYAAVDSPGRAAFDDVNLDPPGGERTRFCHASSLVDDFERSELGPRWFVAGTGCNIGIVAGAVAFQRRVGASGECTLMTTTAYDLENDSTYVHITPISPAASSLPFALAYVLQDRMNRTVAATLTNGWLSLDAGSGGPSRPLEPDVAYWKLLHDPAAMAPLACELATDGTSWTRMGAVMFPDVSAVRILLSMSIATAISTDLAVTVPGYGTP